MDTQWPRWEVFKQDTPGKPHQAVGSVHAADPEHALLTARNVFARRPQAVSMWVVRVSEIGSWTKEEVVASSGKRGVLPGARGPEPGTLFSIFRKTSNKRSMTFVDHVGELEALSPEEALDQALERFTDAQALAWWIVPVEAIHKSEPDTHTIESWFAPAKDKTFKQQSYYGTVGSHASKHKRRTEQEDHED
jgi:ring-1,2-phenylacetyl-CoA epoxidase subunit PaaB